MAPYFPQLDKFCPDSKFILTLREKTAWLRSCETQWQHAAWLKQKSLLTAHYWRFREFITTAVYGLPQFQEDRFSYVYDTHLENVMRYFKGREQDLLVFNICAGEGWERLCPFLGCAIPSVPFPQSNTAADKRFSKRWYTDIEQAVAEIAAVIAAEDLFILVDDAHWDKSLLTGRRTLPFLERDGVYWGPPPDDETAIRELERMRQGGAKFIVFAWSSFWWLEHYAGFHQHLRARYRCVLENERLVIFDLHG